MVPDMVPGTRRRCLVPTTRYQIPGTRCQIPGSWYQVPATRYPLPSTRYQVPGFGCQVQVPGARYLVHGTWYLLPGTCYMVPGTRCLVPGTIFQLVQGSGLLVNVTRADPNNLKSPFPFVFESVFPRLARVSFRCLVVRIILCGSARFIVNHPEVRSWLPA